MKDNEVINWILIRLLFRVSVEGQQHLPNSGPFIITPNHASPLDPPLLAFSLPLAMLQNTYWAGKQSTVLRNRLRRFLSWLTRVIPIIDDRTSLSVGVIILDWAKNLVWFQEGDRSLDGKLQDFKPGVAVLLTRCNVPVETQYATQPLFTFSGFRRCRAVPKADRTSTPGFSGHPGERGVPKRATLGRRYGAGRFVGGFGCSHECIFDRWSCRDAINQLFQFTYGGNSVGDFPESAVSQAGDSGSSEKFTQRFQASLHPLTL